MEVLLAILALFFVFVLPISLFSLLARLIDLQKRVESLEEKLADRVDAKVEQGKTAPLPEEKSSMVREEEVPVESDRQETRIPVRTESRSPELPAAYAERVELAQSTQPKEEAVEQSPVESSHSQPNGIVLWLEKMGLLPPKSDEEGANLMSWWSTRIGLAFGVIAAVFLGLYVNQNTVPLVRLLELVAVAIGVFGAGCWFERKLHGFGRALSAGGLSLFYVSAYAAYGLPAMKVIESPVVGTLVQVAVLMLTVGWSLWKKREAIFGLALVLGYVTCGFSASEGLNPIPLVALILLSLSGTALFAWRNWWSGLWGAVIGSGCGLAVLAIVSWGNVEGPPLSFVYLAMVGLVVFPLVALSLGWLRGEERAKGVVPVVSSIGLLSGAVATWVRGGNFEIYYICFAALFFLVGWWWRRDAGERLWQTLWAKAMVMLALLVVSHFEGPVRAFALLGQVASLIWLARTKKRVIFEVGAMWFGLVGWFLLVFDLGGFEWKREGYFYLLTYLLVSQGCLLGYRLLVGEGLVRRIVTIAFSVMIAAEVVSLSRGYDDGLWFFLIPFSFGVLSLVQRWPLKRKDAEWTPLVVLLVTLFFLLTEAGDGVKVVVQLGVWLAGALGVYAWVGRSSKPMRLMMGIVVMAGILLAYCVVGDQLLGKRWLGCLFAILAMGFAVVSTYFRYPSLPAFGAVASVLGVGWLYSAGWQSGWSLSVGLGLLVSGASWLWGWKHPEGDEKLTMKAEYLRTAVLGIWLWVLLSDLLGGLSLTFAVGVISVLVLGAWHLSRAHSLTWLGAAFVGVGALSLFEANGSAYHPWVVGFYFVLLVGQGIALAHGRAGAILARPKVAASLWGATAMVVALGGLGLRPEVASWTTASWALASVVLLVSGFWFALRGYRYISLVGLVATIGRMFVVDIQDSFWRILAFGITGALLVGIGYLYNRFYKRLVDGDLDWGRGAEDDSV